MEYPDSAQPPERCAICSDERECVEPPGQRWTTLADLERDGHRGSLNEVEPGLFGIDVKPTVGIGQRALLVRSSGGNLLWDPTGYLDDDLIAAVAGCGGSGRDRREPSAHVRRPGRVVAPLRRRTGLRESRRPGLAAARRPGDPALG